MALSEENISPEEKLLKVIKGNSVPVPPRINPFSGSGPVVPPLSAVLESIIGSGSRALKASAPVQPVPVIPIPVIPLPVAPPPEVNVPAPVAKVVEVSSEKSAVVSPVPVVEIQQPAVKIPEPAAEVRSQEPEVRMLEAVAPEPEIVAVPVVEVAEKVSDQSAISSSAPVLPEPVTPPPAVNVPLPVVQPVPAEKVLEVRSGEEPKLKPEPVVAPVASVVPVAPVPAVPPAPRPIAAPVPVRPKPQAVAAPTGKAPEVRSRDDSKSRSEPVVTPVAKVAEIKGQPPVVSSPKVAPAAIPQPARPVAPSAKPVMAPVVEEKAKLKVAKPDVPAAASAKPEAQAPGPVKVDKKQLQDMAKTKATLAEDSVDHAIPPPVVIAKKTVEKKKFGISNVNVGLAVAALLLIAVSVGEIFAKMKNDELLRQPFGPTGQKPADQNVQGGGGSPQVPPLEMLIQGLGDRPVLAMPGQRAKEVPATNGNDQASQVVDWMKYVQDSIKLMGFSGGSGGGLQEAIVQEGKDKDAKLHFLKTGQKFPIQGHEILIESIKDDQVFMTDGKRKMTIR